MKNGHPKHGDGSFLKGGATMNEGAKRSLTIRFVDGTEESFEYSPVEGEEKYKYSLGGLMKEALNANHIIIELAGSVRIIPFQNIKSIEITPRPEMLPEYAVRNARIVS